MSIFRDDCIFHGQLLADFAKQLPAKPIDLPFPAVTVPTEQEAPNHNGAVAAPYVNSIFKDDE